MILVNRIFFIAVFILSIGSVCHAELFTLNNGGDINCEPKISRNGRFTSYCSHTAGLAPTATSEILPSALIQAAPYDPSRFRIFQPVSDDGHPERISTSGVGVNSNGFGFWLNLTSLPFNLSNYWVRSAFGRAADAVQFNWGGEVSYNAFSANDYDEITGMGHTPGLLAGFAAIYNTSGFSRRLPLPAGIRGDSVGVSINNAGIIGGHMVFVNDRERISRAEPHAALWVPRQPSLPKGASYDQLPIDLHVPRLPMPGFTVLGSTLDAVGPSLNPNIGGNFIVRDATRRLVSEHNLGFIRFGVGVGSELSILIGQACKAIDPVDSRFTDLPCVTSTVTGINAEYAVGYVSYELADGTYMGMPFYVPLSLIGEGVYDLNRHIPATSPWHHLLSPTGLSENNIVVGIGSYDEVGTHTTWRGFALQL